MNICADGSSLEAGEQVLSLCLNDDAMADEVQGALFCGAPPAVLGGAVFGLDNGV
jgi:hypothetical protein